MPSLPFRLRAVPCAAAVAFALICAVILPPGPEPARAQQAAPAPAGDSTGQRLSQLEEQMVDLQVAIGTLQSLVARGAVGPGAVANPAGPGPGPGAPAPGGDPDLAGRVDVMETQIRALTSQIEQLAEQIGQLQSQQGGVPQLAPGPAPALQAPGAQAAPFGTTTVQPFQDQPALAPTGQTPAPALDAGQAQPGAGPVAGQTNDRLAALPAGDPKIAYEEAYAHLVQRDYGAAESGFQRFLASFPNDELAGNAQYWLGETYFVRGQYKQAADAFLESYRKYRTGNKAPDSLLKLGMSLNQLGQSQAACDTYNELAAKFPSAPDHVKQRAAGERKRAGC